MKGIDSAGTIYAYKKGIVSKRRSTATFVEDSNLHGSEKQKEVIKQCIVAMCDKKQRKELEEKTLLPVLIIKGHRNSGKNYLMFFTVDTAVAIGCKCGICCAIPSYCEQPFFIISRLIRRMLGMTMIESCIDRENTLMSYLPSSESHDFYLLNHLFIVEFPVPLDVAASINCRDEKISKLCKMIVLEFSKNRNTLIAVDNADYMDDESWYILHALSEEDRILMVLTLTMDFKEDNVAANTLLLKAYLHVNMDALEEDFFAPALCWFLGVKAVHTKIFLHLKEITQGRTPLLKEISLCPAIFQYIDIIPFDSVDPDRISKEFYVEEFEMLKDEVGFACDLKPGTDIKEAMIPTNINDAVKECMNNLTIQDRLLLKRAAVLGSDFDLHSLESISAGMTRTEVLQSISNLLSNYIFSSVCTLENMIDMKASKVSGVKINILNTCLCFFVYLKTRLKYLSSTEWSIGPYHNLKFRTQEFRSCILAYMTRDQLYSMHMEVADKLEKDGPECAACKSKRTGPIEVKHGMKRIPSYSIGLEKCECLEQRPKVFSLISTLYASIGMVFLPPYFMRKAAQAKNNVNLPVEALYYVQIAASIMPEYWIMSEEDRWEAESYFDSLILEVSLTKTQAESFFILGDTYHAASSALNALEMLGIDSVYLHGVFNPKDFKRILPRFELLHAENITKLIGILAKTYLSAHSYKLAQDLLRIEFVALSSYPIDFLQVLNHMASMYKVKYLIHEHETLQDLENNIYKLCHDKLQDMEIRLDLPEVNGIGTAYSIIVEVKLALALFLEAERAANEAVRILQIYNSRRLLVKIRVLLSHIHFHKKEYLNCCYTLMDLGEMSIVTSNRIHHALYTCSLSMLLMKSTKGINKSEIQHNFDKCNAFASMWKDKIAEVLPKDLAFYVSICLAHWCLYSDKTSMWLGGQTVFINCYRITLRLHDTIDKSTHNYWVIAGIVLLLKLQVKSLTEDIEGVETDESFIQEELNYLKPKIKRNYPVFMKVYKKLVDAIHDKKKEKKEPKEQESIVKL